MKLWRSVCSGRSGCGSKVEVDLPPIVQRAIAYLAIVHRPIPRNVMVETLWPGSPPARGRARLRNVIWKANSTVPGLVVSREMAVDLSHEATVDYSEARAVCHQALGLDEHHGVFAYGAELLLDDLLPHWDVEWLDAERRAYSVFRVRALEREARRFFYGGMFFGAEQACEAIIAAEPYRESARLLLAEVHLAEGNGGLAMQELVGFRDLLRRDLGIAPNGEIQSLISSLAAAV